MLNAYIATKRHVYQEFTMSLSSKQLMAAQLMSIGKSKTFIGNELGVSARQVYTWSVLPEFQVEVSRLLSEAEEEARYQLKSLVSTSLAAIAEILADKEASDNVRMGGAIKVLELVMLKGVVPVSQAEETSATPKVISLETLRRVREEIYGVHDDEPESELQKQLPGSAQ
jgi:hypothetical protein